jgi:hypothetical protein
VEREIVWRRVVDGYQTGDGLGGFGITRRGVELKSEEARLHADLLCAMIFHLRAIARLQLTCDLREPYICLSVWHVAHAKFNPRWERNALARRS